MLCRVSLLSHNSCSGASSTTPGSLSQVHVGMEILRCLGHRVVIHYSSPKLELPENLHQSTVRHPNLLTNQHHVWLFNTPDYIKPLDAFGTRGPLWDEMTFGARPFTMEMSNPKAEPRGCYSHLNPRLPLPSVTNCVESVFSSVNGGWRSFQSWNKVRWQAWITYAHLSQVPSRSQLVPFQGLYRIAQPGPHLLSFHCMLGSEWQSNSKSDMAPALWTLTA